MSNVNISLSEDEALVLFDFLARFTDTDRLGTEDQAEQRVLWDLHCLLERQIVAVFDPDYRKLVFAARDAIRDDGGTDGEVNPNS